MNELVSIIMPSYNTAKFISKTIESVLEQTYKNWELLIVDDCSTDNTDEIVSKYDDDRIIYLKNKKNSGAAVSRNKALKNAIFITIWCRNFALFNGIESGIMQFNSNNNR